MNSVGQNKFCTVAVQFLIGLHIVIGGGLDHTDQSESLCNHAVCGEELFLTSFLSSGRIAEGREAAKVTDILPGVSSYSGFFTVNETLGSNLFFWFFPAESGSKEAPIVLWLNGGPGRAFADTLFRLNGPFTIVDGPQLMPNLLYWSEAVNVIFIDIPVGTGFSFTKSLGNHSQQEVGSDLLSAVKQFFQLFPEYSKNEFYIIGQSYGGKYATSLAYLIHQSNPRYRSKINLSGVAIGGGWIDPVNQIDYSPYLYYLGLIDLKTQQKFADVESQIKSVIKKKNYGKAFDMFNKYFLGKFSQPSLAENVTGFSVWNNYLENDWRENDRNIDVLMNNVSWRKSMHVGDVQFNLDHPAEFEHIRDDYMVSVAPWLETLMDHYRVLLFNGELDVVCPYPLAINYVRQLKWKGAEMYSKAQRKQWHVLGSLAGYAKTAGNFTEVLIRDTGHEVLQSRLLVLDILSRFTRNISFDVPTH